MKVHYDPALILPSQASLLQDTLPFILNGWRPGPGQTRIEHAELLTLARGIPDEALHVLERSQAWVEL